MAIWRKEFNSRACGIFERDGGGGKKPLIAALPPPLFLPAYRNVPWRRLATVKVMLPTSCL